MSKTSSFKDMAIAGRGGDPVARCAAWYFILESVLITLDRMDDDDAFDDVLTGLIAIAEEHSSELMKSTAHELIARLQTERAKDRRKRPPQ